MVIEVVDKPKKETVRGKLVELIDGRSSLEWGEMAVIARQLGCSRERVRQLANLLGLPRRMKVSSQSSVCPSCRGTKSPRSLVCASCKVEKSHPWVNCRNCGKPFRTRRSVLKRYLMYKGSRRYGMLCKKNCSGKVLVDCVFCGQEGHVWPSALQRRHFCNTECVSQARNLISVRLWSMIPISLLPMREHQSEIRSLIRNLKN